jgi:hypothetical protein
VACCASAAGMMRRAAALRAAVRARMVGMRFYISRKQQGRIETIGEMVSIRPWRAGAVVRAGLADEAGGGLRLLP